MLTRGIWPNMASDTPARSGGSSATSGSGTNTSGRSAAETTSLVRHGVNEIVQAIAVGKRRHMFRILGSIGVFPRVSYVRVVVDRDDHPAFTVVHGAPGGLSAVGLLNHYGASRTAPEMPGTRNKRQVVRTNIEQDVHHGVGIGNVIDRLVRENAVHG